MSLRLSRKKVLGFTLLEVMVAIAILSLGLTAIFSSQGGAIKTAHRSRKMTMASLLARCKMGEIEEMIARDGLPAVDAHDVDGCCEDGEIDGYECDWKVERIVLPDDYGPGEEDIDSDDPLASLSKTDDADIGSGFTGAGAVDTMLTGGGMGGGIDSIAMSFAYPVMKPVIEEQVRRATVIVRWDEGTKQHEFDLSQFLVSEAPLPPEAPAP